MKLKEVKLVKNADYNDGKHLIVYVGKEMVGYVDFVNPKDRQTKSYVYNWDSTLDYPHQNYGWATTKEKAVESLLKATRGTLKQYQSMIERFVEKP